MLADRWEAGTGFVEWSPDGTAITYLTFDPHEEGIGTLKLVDVGTKSVTIFCDNAFVGFFER